MSVSSDATRQSCAVAISYELLSLVVSVRLCCRTSRLCAAMKEYWQMLEPDGLLLLAVPLFGFDRFLYHCTIIPLYRHHTTVPSGSTGTHSGLTDLTGACYPTVLCV